MALAGAGREEANAFLKKQGALIDDQRHHLREQFKHLHLSVWEKQLGVLLRLATAVVGIVFAAGLALLVWDASHATGLFVEPFSVPPEMISKGLSGQVIAGQVLDKLTTMQNQTESPRTAQSYANNWGSDIKVEIPETGVSIGEFRRFLRGWLGHDTHISGEVFRTPTGIAVTARAGADAGATFTGAETDLDALVQKAAEHVYASTQPYRFGNWLDRNVLHPETPLRLAEAAAVYRKLIESGDDIDKAWAWNGLGTLAWIREGDQRRAIEYYDNAVGIWPDFTIGHYALGFKHSEISHPEQALTHFRIASRLLHRGGDLNPLYVPPNAAASDMMIALQLGDYAEAETQARRGVALQDTHATMSRSQFRGFVRTALNGLHDAADLRIDVANAPCGGGTAQNAAAFQQWQIVIVSESCTEKRTAAVSETDPLRLMATLRPLLALAHAKLGDIAQAQAVIATTPPDSYLAMRVRGMIGEQAKQWARADWWFARATAFAPSIPFAETDWGMALLARDKSDEAIEKFKLANQKGPHFADPLEGWGEALMAKNQSHLALAKFAEAEKCAPNWGRLHLKWGEALVWAGKRDDAKAQFARAAQLDLTPSEKSELARHP